MSPMTAEVSRVMLESESDGAADEHSRAVLIRPSDDKSFARLLSSKRQDTTQPTASAPAGGTRAESPSRLSAWQQVRFLATATVNKQHWQPGRQVVTESNSRLLAYPQRDRMLARSRRGSYARPLSLDPTPGSPTRDLSPENCRPLALGAFPRPANDNGWGMHWIPTLQSSPEVVDRFVAELKEMGIKWAVFLNNGADIGANDYLVRRLSQNGIMPVMRIYTPGLVPIKGDLEAMVQHYKALGVSYFQLYNEPNLELENGGEHPNVDRYLDLWAPAAERVLAAGGLPGFGALSPNGEFDDCQFLREALDGLKRRGEAWLLNRGWLSMHNYAGPLALDNPDGFPRFERYAQILRKHLGRVIPIVGTEAGSYVTEGVDESRQVDLVTGAYRHMSGQREPYNFSYTYWVVANKEGGGKDDEFEWQALFRPGGWVSPLVKALKGLAGRR